MIDIADLILSKDIRQYMEKQGRVLTDFEKAKAVSKLMGHAKEIITMDVYADNRNIIADGVPEIL